MGCCAQKENTTTKVAKQISNGVRSAAASVSTFGGSKWQTCPKCDGAPDGCRVCKDKGKIPGNYRICKTCQGKECERCDYAGYKQPTPIPTIRDNPMSEQEIIEMNKNMENNLYDDNQTNDNNQINNDQINDTNQENTKKKDDDSDGEIQYS